MEVLDLIDKFRNFEGKNSYICYLRDNVRTLTESQRDFLRMSIDNFQDAKVIDDVFNITKFFSDSLKEKYKLDFDLKKIKILKIYGHNEKAYIGDVKFTTKGKVERIWIPKSQIDYDLLKYEKKDLVIDWSKYDARPPMEHQKEAVITLLKNENFILGDDLGLGKTTSSIIAAIESAVDRIVVICPASLKYNWKKEITNYIDSDLIWVCNNLIIPDNKMFYIFSYDDLEKFMILPEKGKRKTYIEQTLLDVKFNIMICDEAHAVKYSSSQRSKYVKHLRKMVDRVWLLTGTPITNRPKDFFNLLQLCNHPLTYNYNSYLMNYCEGKRKVRYIKGKKSYYWDANGASNLEELYERTKSIFLRRLKKDVLKDLKDSKRIITYHEMPNKNRYLEIKENLELSKEKGAKLVLLSALKKFVAIEKLQITIDLIDSAISEGNKVVVFTCYNEVIERLIEHYKFSAVKIDGSMSASDRQKAVDMYQENPDIKLMVCNIIAGGAGTTLTAGCITIFNDLDYVPSNHMQAEGRQHRIGQLNEVLFYYPLFEDSIEIFIFDLLNLKTRIINKAVDGLNDKDFNETYLIEDETSIEDILIEKLT